MRVQPGLYRNYKLLASVVPRARCSASQDLKICSAWDKVSHTVFRAVVPDVASISPHGHEEHWLEKDIPGVGSIYRLCPGDSDDVNTILHARELDKRVDFSIIREWLLFCSKYHDGVCKRGMLQASISQGFRVINCVKDPPAVEDQPWGITYAALSYVWGKSPMEQWPKTVLDAVAVTKEMGLQYLWVDRLCVDQTNLAEKHYLISTMVTIYSEPISQLLQQLVLGQATGSQAYDRPLASLNPSSSWRAGADLYRHSKILVKRFLSRSGVCEVGRIKKAFCPIDDWYSRTTRLIGNADAWLSTMAFTFLFTSSMNRPGHIWPTSCWLGFLRETRTAAESLPTSNEKKWSQRLVA